MMKKTMMLLAIMLLSVMSMSAQNLIGTWKTTMDSDGQPIKFYLAFNGQTTLKMKIAVTMNDPEVGSFTIAVNMKGTYSKKGSRLNLHFTPKTAIVKLQNVKWAGNVKAAIESSPEKKKMFDEMLEEQLQSVKNDIVNEIPFGETMIIKTLTSKILEIHSDVDNQTVTFTKVVKK